MDPRRAQSSRTTDAPIRESQESAGAPHPRLPPAPHFAVTPAVGPAETVSSSPSSQPAPSVQRTARQILRGIAFVCAWEIKTFLLRPASYILLLAAALLAGWSFSWLVTLLSRGIDPALRPADDPISQFLGPNVFLIGACTLIIPLLSMNAIADERRRGSWELLLTTPVSSLTVVLGKFAALWCLFMTCLAPWFYYLAVLHAWNGRTKLLWNLVPWSAGAGLDFDWGPVGGGLGGLAMVGATFVATGLFCSGLCRGPASAGLLALVAMGGILVVGFVPRIMEYWSFSAEQISFCEAVSCWGHVERFSRGVIEPRIIAGHMSVCAALLWGTAWVARRVDDG
jgi:ABC-2 type transport system permease protein